MKKTSKTPERILPISQKAYESFRQRIIYINDLFGLDPHYMLWLYEEYLCGHRHAKSGGGLACDMTFKMLCGDIDRAIARSSRAREAARLRRERRIREQQERNTQQAQAIPEMHDVTPAVHSAFDATTCSTSVRQGQSDYPPPPQKSGVPERDAKSHEIYIEALKTCIREQLYPPAYNIRK